MRGLKFPLLIIIPLSFLLGLFWGFKIYRGANTSGKPKTATQIRVLTLEGVLPNEVVDRFTRASGIGIELVVAKDPESLWSSLAGKERFDAVSLLSYQVPLAMNQRLIDRIHPTLLKQAAAMTPDFSDLPGDSGHEGVVPILWGVVGYLADPEKVPDSSHSWQELIDDPKLKGQIGFLRSTPDVLRISKPIPLLVANGEFSPSFWLAAPLFDHSPPARVVQINHGEGVYLQENHQSHKKWRFRLPSEKGSLWVLSFALSRDSKRTTETHQFFDFLLEQSTALDLVEHTHQASTNRTLEKAVLDARLKPSYLRTIPLTDIAVPVWTNQKMVDEAIQTRVLIDRLTSPVAH